MSKLTMQNGAPVLKLNRSSHNLSNQTVFDVEQNWLVPTAVYDVVPGDKFNLKTSHLVRTTPLVKPAMLIDIAAKTASFFTPYRTIWKPFEEFFSGGRTGDKVIPLPVICLSHPLFIYASQYSLFDYFDLPTKVSNYVGGNKKFDFINCLYFLAYLKIWNDYFRNPSIDIEVDVLNLTIYKPNSDTPYVFTGNIREFTYNGVNYSVNDITYFFIWSLGIINNLVNPSELDTTNFNVKAPSVGSDLILPAIINLPRDIFTSALPTASSSNPVSLGLSGGFDSSNFFSKTSSIPLNLSTETSLPLAVSGMDNDKSRSSLYSISVNTNTGVVNRGSAVSSLLVSPDFLNKAVNPDNSLSISGIYPRELRLVFGLDLKQQIRNLTGNRYQDLLRAFYGVTTQDYRVNMAEYIGGGRSPIYTSEVLQTSESNETPLGEQAGHAISSGIHNHGSYFVRELGCIINLFWINSSMAYSQQLRRDWRKLTVNDFFFPMFEKIGDQEIFEEEIVYKFYTDGFDNSRIFGFSPRYSEYKFYNHTVKGGIRGNYKYWTQSRFFSISSGSAVSPVLSSEFIKPDYSSVNRVFQTIEGSDYTLKPYIVKFENRTIAYRPMVENSLGYLIDHF